jgi:hopanoid biosynthesis associated protein HpnK
MHTYEMKRFLIVTADDFGLHRSVNEAVQEAATAGVLTAASLMVSAPATADAVKRARELPGLRVGLHLVLADGWSVLPRRIIPALVDGNGRFGNHMFVDGVRFFAHMEVRRQVAAEIRAQFEAFARTGLVLDHVNAHKHFHLHPTLLSIILNVGRAFGLKAMRVPHEPFWFATRGLALAGGASSALLAPWVVLMRRRLRAHGIVYNDRLFGIARSGSLDEAALVELLENLPPGVSEIYLHPATHTQTPLSLSTRRYRHAEELYALLSTRVREVLAHADLMRGGYLDIVNARAGAPA